MATSTATVATLKPERILVRLTSGKTARMTVSELRKQLRVNQVELARLTGYATRSIASWESGTPLSPPARLKMAEVVRLTDAIKPLVPSGDVSLWLKTPNDGFDGQTPMQVIERGESDRIWQMIYQIEAGVAE